MNQLDFSARDLSTATPRLTDELVIIPEHYGDRTVFHLEVPSKSRFYRVGEAEYTFLSLLDGRTTIAAAVAETARVLGRDSFTEQEGVAVCKWLTERSMIDLQTSGSEDLMNLDGTNELRKLAAGMNPLWIKKSFGNPDRLLNTLSGFLGWIHSPVAILVWLVVCGAAIATLLQHAAEFRAAPHGLLSQSNWIWLALSWLVLKVIHELAHGLAAKRYGGNVPEAGAAFILFIPMAYVDVTSSYRFRSRWHRVHTAIAGMYAELFLAAIATILWPLTDSPEVRSQLYNVMFTASFTTLLFNANALMRFDGYFVLADVLNIPNLYVDGQQYVSGIWKRVLLGEPRQPMEWQGWKGVVVRLYGVLAAMWRVVISASLIIASSVMFHGAGVALAALAVTAWFVIPACQALKRESAAAAARFGRQRRALVVGTAVAGGLVAATTLIPWPGDRTAPAIVQFEPRTILRAQSAGFVDEILVRDGQQVRAGQVLLRLRNRELEADLRELEFEVARSAAAQRMYLQQEELASAQIEERNQLEKQRQLDEHRTQVAALELKAPRAGRVIARDLAAKAGSYVKAGDTLLEVASEQSKEIQVSVAQPDIDAYRASLGHPLRVYVRGIAPFDATLRRVEPRASRTPRHESFTVTAGGPIAVVPKQAENDEGPAYEYVTPRFLAHIELPRQRSLQLHSGQSGYVSLPSGDVSLGRGVYRLVADWVDEQIRTTTMQ